MWVIIIRTCSMKSLNSSHFSLKFFFLLWLQHTDIQKLMSEIDVWGWRRPWDCHMQSWLGTGICFTALFTICIFLLVVPVSVTAIELFLDDSWMGQACQKLLFPIHGWELVCTCGLESNKLCKVLASGLWHLWGMSKDKLLRCIWCGDSGSSYLTNCWLQFSQSKWKSPASRWFSAEVVEGEIPVQLHLNIECTSVLVHFYWQLHPHQGLIFKWPLESICV